MSDVKPSPDLVITQVVVTKGDRDQVALWNRGDYIGSVDMRRGDGEQFARALLSVRIYDRSEVGREITFKVSR